MTSRTSSPGTDLHATRRYFARCTVFASWRGSGDDGRTPAVILSVAHLDDDERMLVLGVVLEQFLAWVRAQSGAQQLRALLVFDEL